MSLICVLTIKNIAALYLAVGNSGNVLRFMTTLNFINAMNTVVVKNMITSTRMNSEFRIIVFAY